MLKQVSIALAAGLLVAGITAASAAGMQSSSPTSKTPKMSPQASDTLSLTTAQQKMAWNDLHGRAAEQEMPSGFNATVGATVPSAIKVEPIPSTAVSNVPSLRPYDFALVKGKLLIVNPSDKRIAEVISG